MYTADVVNIVERQRLSAHQYADDIQVYSRCRPNDSTSLCRDLGGCIEHVASCMGTNRLQLNAAKAFGAKWYVIADLIQVSVLKHWEAGS